MIKSDTTLRILHAGEISQPIRNLARIAECLGIDAAFAKIDTSAGPVDQLRDQIQQPGPLVLDLATIASLIPSEQWSAISDDFCASHNPSLVLAQAADALQSTAVRHLSGGGLAGITDAGTPSPPEVHFSSDKLLTAQLAGLKFPRSTRPALAFVNAVPAKKQLHPILEFLPGIAPFIAIDGQAQSIQQSQTNQQAPPKQESQPSIFLWATPAIFDIDQPLTRELEFEQALDEYIPAIIFLRAAFGDRCWHNPRLDADIVIDDPLLSPRYGFIDFPTVLPLARQLGIHITIAFIPWNHWRTQPSDIDAFRNYPDNFSICAHGCDHIKGEFRTTDYSDLLARSHLAAARMDAHRQRTGMDWDPLMVCPREEYTAEAMHALADSGRYLGMVNTGCIPRDLADPQVRAADLLQPAQDSFFGFPLFKRHYWYGGIHAFAMSAFLGKPAILVEHHNFFQNDCEQLRDFVSQLHGIAPHVQWSSLRTIATHTHSIRRTGPGSIAVRFFSDEFIFENPDAQPRIVTFQRRLPASMALDHITIDGADLPFTRRGDFAYMETEIPARSRVQIHMQRPIVQPAKSGMPQGAKGATYTASVATRRILSELRDNLLSRSQPVLKMANRLMEAAGSR